MGLQRSGARSVDPRHPVRGNFTDTARDRIQGSVQVRYQHRAGDTQPDADFVVTEEFTLTQVAN